MDEFVVIACDGIWDVMTSQAVVNYVRRELHCHNNLTTAAQNLVAEAINCGSIDNCSVVLVALNQHFRDR